MAGFTRAGHRAVVHACARPRKRGMAVIAGITADDMAWVFAGRVSTVVTTTTLLRRAFKHTFHMASFACGAHVLAAERKAGREVIEARIDFGGLGGTQNPRQHAHKHKRETYSIIHP